LQRIHPTSATGKQVRIPGNRNLRWDTALELLLESVSQETALSTKVSVSLSTRNIDPSVKVPWLRSPIISPGLFFKASLGGSQAMPALLPTPYR
jgi:hypothetical protein